MLPAEGVMPGLRMPHKIVKGRLQTESGEEQLTKVVMIAAGSRDNTNPWNLAGIDADPFSLNDSTMQANIRRGLLQHFRRLERGGRAALETLKFRQEEADLFVDLVYLDLVRGEQSTASIPVLQSLGGSI